MIGRIIFSLLFIAFYFGIEYYAFNGLKILFKSGMPRAVKWSYWILVAFPILWLFIGRGLFEIDLRWLNNAVIGIFISLIVAKLFFILFLALEDIYRILRFGTESVMAIGNEEKHANFESRRRFVAQIGIAVASIPFLSFLYGVTRGKYAYTVHNIQVAYKDLPEAFDGLRILQISDIHSGSFDSMAAVERGVEMIQAQKADIILFTGDLVNSHAHEIEPYVDIFKSLSAPLGKFSVLGNHDYGHYPDGDERAVENMKALQGHHATMGFRLLNNENQFLEKNGEKIRLVGVENWGKSKHFPKEGDLDKAFEGVDPEEFCILMSHDPSHWEAKILDFPKKVQLTLSGHTHGMQLGVEIPGMKWSPSKYLYPQWAGLYEREDQKIYVNRGFGFLGFPGRVGILPEITVLELKKA